MNRSPGRVARKASSSCSMFRTQSPGVQGCLGFRHTSIRQPVVGRQFHKALHGLSRARAQSARGKALQLWSNGPSPRPSNARDHRKSGCQGWHPQPAIRSPLRGVENFKRHVHATQTPRHRNPGRPAHAGSASVPRGGREIHHGRARCGAGLPLLIPVARPRSWRSTSCSTELDGLFFTGSPSNVEPHRYGGEPSRPGHAARSAARRDDAAADPARDRGRRAGARRLPRFPGNERRLRRHALAARARSAGPSRASRGPRRSRWTCSTRRRTK